MAEFLSKSAYAKLRGKRPSAVSNWISRGLLTSPALRMNGQIDVAKADQQLGLLDPNQDRSGKSRKIPEESAEEAVFTPSHLAQKRLIEARALDVEIRAEKNRRELNAERGKYILTDEIRAEFGRGILEHLMTVEQSLPELASRLGAGLDGLLELRRWWREQCQQTADRNRMDASNFPDYMEDPT